MQHVGFSTPLPPRSSGVLLLRLHGRVGQNTRCPSATAHHPLLWAPCAKGASFFVSLPLHSPLPRAFLNNLTESATSSANTRCDFRLELSSLAMQLPCSSIIKSAAASIRRNCSYWRLRDLLQRSPFGSTLGYDNPPTVFGELHLPRFCRCASFLPRLFCVLLRFAAPSSRVPLYVAAKPQSKHVCCAAFFMQGYYGKLSNAQMLPDGGNLDTIVVELTQISLDPYFSSFVPTAWASGNSMRLTSPPGAPPCASRPRCRTIS